MLLTLSNKCPVEIINESFGEINISRDIRRLFLEKPFSIHRDELTKESLKHMIAASLNSYDTRLNLTYDGIILLERKGDFHTPNIDRYLILNSGIDGYVGPKAASNREYIDELFDVVNKFINEGPLGSNKIEDLVKAKVEKY